MNAALVVANALDGEIVTAEQVEYIRQLDLRIVSQAAALKEQLLEMQESGGYAILGYASWQQYIESVSDRAGVSPSTLRRYVNQAKAARELGFGTDAVAEGITRSITEILSPAKGFGEGDRREAFEEALETAGGNLGGLTMAIAGTVAKRHYYLSRAKDGRDENVALIADRAESGAISIDDAYALVRVVETVKDSVVAGVVARTSGIEAARVILNALPTSAAQDLVLGAASSGVVYVGDNAVQIEDATRNDIADALNQESRLVAKESAATRWRLISALVDAAKSLVLDDLTDKSNLDIARIYVSLYLLGHAKPFWVHDGIGAHLDDDIKFGIRSGMSIAAIADALFDMGVDSGMPESVIANRVYCVIEELMREE